jgi:hypothetical protein
MTKREMAKNIDAKYDCDFFSIQCGNIFAI